MNYLIVVAHPDDEVVFTHHPADLNNDHLHTSLACQAAARLFQRRPDLTLLKELLFMEVPSDEPLEAYAATNKNKEVIINSASGGFFGAIDSIVLE